MSSDFSIIVSEHHSSQHEYDAAAAAVWYRDRGYRVFSKLWIDVMRCYIPHRHVDIKTGGRTENENEGKVNKTVVNHNM